MSTISSLTNKCIKYTLADKDQELAIPSLKLLDELSNGVNSSIGNINDELNNYYKKTETSSDSQIAEAFENISNGLDKKIESSDISFIYDEQEKTLGLSAFGNKIATIDCTQFIKDGMLSSVKLSNDNVLWMYFNVDGNAEPISIDMQQVNDTYAITSAEGSNTFTYQLQKKSNGTENFVDVENGKIVIPKYSGQTFGTINTMIDPYHIICASINPGVISAYHLEKGLSDYINSIKEIADAATTSSEVEQIADSYVQPILNDYTTSAQAGTIAEQFMADLSADVYENEDNNLHTKLFTNQQGFLVGSLPKDKNTYYKDSQVVYYTKSTIQKVDCDKNGNITNTYFDLPLSSGRLLVDTDDYTTSAEASSYAANVSSHISDDYYRKNETSSISQLTEKFNSYVPLSIDHDVDIQQNIEKDGMFTINCKDGAMFRVFTDMLETRIAGGVFSLKTREEYGAGEIELSADEHKSALALNSLNISLLGSNTTTVSADSTRIYLNDVNKTLRAAFADSTKLYNDDKSKYLDGDLNYYDVNDDYWVLSGDDLIEPINLYRDKDASNIIYRSTDKKYVFMFDSAAWRFIISDELIYRGPTTTDTRVDINANVNDAFILDKKYSYVLNKKHGASISKVVLSSELPTQVSYFENDAGYVTSAQVSNDYYHKTETSSSVQLTNKFDELTKSPFQDNGLVIQPQDMTTVGSKCIAFTRDNFRSYQLHTLGENGKVWSPYTVIEWPTPKYSDEDQKFLITEDLYDYVDKNETSNIASTYVQNAVDDLSTIESVLTGSEVLNSISETSGKISITKRNLSAVDLDGISSLVSTIASSYYDALSNYVFKGYGNPLHEGDIFYNKEGFQIGTLDYRDSLIYIEEDKIEKIINNPDDKDNPVELYYYYPDKTGNLIVDTDISNYVKVDKELSYESENPVQNKVITQKLAERDYTGFQVWPTVTNIAVGTALSTLAPIKDRLDFFKNNSKLSTILNETVKVEIPAGDTQYFTLRCNSGKSDLSLDNIIVDWGDGTTSSYNEMLIDPVLSANIVAGSSDNGGLQTEVTFSHDYNVEDNEHLFNIKIYGNKNFGVKNTNNQTDTSVTCGGNLICRCMDNEYPIASNFVNITDLCKDSYKLFIIVLPNYSHMFDGIQNASRTFQNCKNLIITHNFNDQFRFCRLNCFFKGCENMITTDIVIPAFIVVQQYNQISKGGDSIVEMFNGCKNLVKDVNELLPPNGFMARRININDLFKDCAKLTCSNDDSMAEILWGDTSKLFNYDKTNRRPFAGTNLNVNENWK